MIFEPGCWDPGPLDPGPGPMPVRLPMGLRPGWKGGPAVGHAVHFCVYVSCPSTNAFGRTFELFSSWVGVGHPAQTLVASGALRHLHLLLLLGHELFVLTHSTGVHAIVASKLLIIRLVLGLRWAATTGESSDIVKTPSTTCCRVPIRLLLLLGEIHLLLLLKISSERVALQMENPFAE